MIYSLGVSSFSHDSAAALIGDGEVLALIEQERLNRHKYTTAFPKEAIELCLQIAGLKIDELDCISFFNRPELELWGGLRHALLYFPKSLHLFQSKFGGNQPDDAQSFLKRVKDFMSFQSQFEAQFPNAADLRFQNVEHHLAHAASCFYPSPFEESAILTWDGRGEMACTLGATGDATGLKKVFQIEIPHSLGIFYTAITEYLGFQPFSDEWKVMGLSAYGTPRLVQAFDEIIAPDSKKLYRLNLHFFSFQYYGRNRFFSEGFSKKFGPSRKKSEPLTAHHYDIAFAAQRLIEKIGLSIANELQARTGQKNLCMTGGVAQNILLNSYIMDHSHFENYFIQPVATDAGASLGAALYSYHDRYGARAQRSLFCHAYLGPEFSESEILGALTQAGLEFEHCSDIAQEVAKSLHQGKIIGWFQGRMECGPRALGNRSLLANPTRIEYRERLNVLIKKRENFRPFAPAVLSERADEYFTGVHSSGTDFMIASAHVREDKKHLIPAVVHIDGSARPQTVRQETNPRFHLLLSEFSKLSGVPVLLNTSFNEQEPIVCQPSDAIATFLRSEIDELAIGNFLVRKSNRPPKSS